MNQSGHHTLVGAFWVVLAQSLIAPIGFATVIFLTRALGPAGYGHYALVLTLVTWVELGISAMFSRSAVKFISAARDWQPVATTLVQWYLTAGGLAMLALWAAADPLARALGTPELALWIRLAALDVPVFAAAQAHVQILVGLGRFRSRAWLGALRWTARFVLIVLLVTAGLSVAGAVLGVAASSALMLLVCRRQCRPPVFVRSTFKGRRLWSYSIPLMLSAWSFNLLAGLDLMALKLLGVTADQVGVYGAALNVATMPSIVAAGVAPLLLSTVSRLRQQGAAAEARQIASQGLRLGVLVAPFLAAVAGSAGELTRLLFGPGFVTTGLLMPALLLAGLGRLMVTVTHMILIAAGRPTWTAYLMAPPVLLAVVAFPLAIPVAGAVGAASVAVAVWWLAAGAALAALIRFGWPAVRRRTVFNAVVSSAAVFALAILCPTPGLLVLLKLALLAAAAMLALLGLGELDRRELTWIRSLLGTRARAT